MCKKIVKYLLPQYEFQKEVTTKYGDSLEGMSNFAKECGEHLRTYVKSKQVNSSLPRKWQGPRREKKEK